MIIQCSLQQAEPQQLAIMLQLAQQREAADTRLRAVIWHQLQGSLATSRWGWQTVEGPKFIVMAGYTLLEKFKVNPSRSNTACNRGFMCA